MHNGVFILFLIDQRGTNPWKYLRCAVIIRINFRGGSKGHQGRDPSVNEGVPQSPCKRCREYLCASLSMSISAAQARRRLAFEDRCFEILPRHIVVFVRIPGCSSLAVLAKCLRSSPFRIRSESFGARERTALTVCSRTRGTTSENPVTFTTIR